MSTAESDITSKLYFEPCVHPTDQDVVNSTVKDLKTGDIDAHLWDDAARERMREYSPSVISIDSLDPIQPDNKGDVELDLSAKEWIWSLMPGRPSQINGGDRIVVVAGDNLYNDPNANSFGQLAFRASNIAVDFSLVKIGGNVADEYIKEAREYFRDYDPISGQYLDPSRDAMKPINRRSFFKLASYIGLGVVAFSDQIFPYIPSRSAIEAEQKIDNIADDIFLYDNPAIDSLLTYIDGRTALLIAKMSDVLNGDFKESKSTKRIGSIVMGDGHANRSEELMVNPDLRADCIRAHMEAMLAAVPADHTYFRGRWTNRQKFQYLHWAETSLQFYEVTEPDDKKLKQDYHAEIERTVSYIGQAVSPSVSRAIESLI
jgi:hypothetical protein